MKDVKLVAAFAENKPGQVAHFTKILANANINIRWLAVASTGPYGVMKFLVNDPDRACEAFKHEGLIAKLVDALAIEISDRPGGLHAVAACLAGQDINLDNASGFIANNRAFVVIEVSDHAPARDILQQHGFRVLAQDELPLL
jgi:hypothetical protein